MDLRPVTLVNDDSLKFIKTLPDNCIDLIATDPPYFRVKDCHWDNQWEDVTAYLAWLDELLAEFWRVLKPNGSLYMFCGSRLASDTELLVRERFNVLNQIIWAKPSGPWRRQHKESLRMYFPATERIIFAEHYQGPYHPKGDGYFKQCRELKQSVFKPLVDYFRDARKALGITAKAIHKATGKPADLMAHIIQSSSREGELVADFFMGSGATLKAALKLNRRVLGVELEEDRFKKTEQEIKLFINK
ncbi:DNA-methyltransferase [Xenorhabdus stockiae]|uniref:DNA-methyltransferase n=1 Tax=Xenorhabdus stockiae TaxID=351614 RepID=UPI004064B94A